MVAEGRAAAVRLRYKPARYNGVRDNYQWGDHVYRLLTTAAAIAWLEPNTVLDPACGDASIVRSAHRLRNISAAVLSDISERQIDALRGQSFDFQVQLSAEDAARTMNREVGAEFDTVVLTEFLEHVEDPLGMLLVARQCAKTLVASSPLDETTSVPNDEHLWSWSKEAYEQMLVDAGWKPTSYVEIAFRQPGWPYAFQLWTAQ